MATKTRDYKHEYKIRVKRIKRLHADINKDKVEAFQALLQGRGVTFVSWLEIQINKELDKA